jgi:hypothetical protein
LGASSVTVDGLGNPLRLILTGGHRHDVTQAYYLLEGCDFERLLADRGYSAEHFINALKFCENTILGSIVSHIWLNVSSTRLSIFDVSFLALKSWTVHFSVSCSLSAR